MKEDTSRKS